MSEFEADILDFMAACGCKPHGGKIIINDEKHRFKPEGNKKPSGVYSFKFTESGGVIGWFCDHREGITHKYCSKRRTELTPEQKKAYKENLRKEQAARRARLKRQRDDAASKAQGIWDRAERGEHGYLKAKGICGAGSRVWQNVLLVPAYNKAKQITTLQFIQADGQKRFLKNGEITGCYGSIGKDTSKVYISEGYATAKSVYKAVKPYVSAWAFNAGNLLEVARIMRDKFPGSEIIICADNDHATKNARGEPWNPGMEKAVFAARDINGLIIWPDVTDGTDFNDYEKNHGVDKLRDRIGAAAKVASWGGAILPVLGVVAIDEKDGAPPQFDEVPLDAYEQDLREYYGEQDIPMAVIEAKGNWKALLKYGGRDGDTLKPNSLINKILFLAHDDRYRGIFRLNEFASSVFVCRCPPWEDERTFKAHLLNDIDITNCAADLETFALSPDRTAVLNAINSVAEKYKFHPAREYFDNLKWDGHQRLEKWLTYYMGAEEDEPEYLAFIGKKWLTAAVKRVFKPGCKFDHVLVAEGSQGAGKSTFFKKLATFGDKREEESYFTDSITIGDIQNKDTIQKIQGSIICELAELAGFNKKDDEEIKRWITLQHDDTRLPYEKTVKRFYRQFVLAATTNSYDYLKDPTGNRRYWPFVVGSIDMAALENDKDQLWAEAVYHYKNGLYIGPTDGEMKLAEIAQNSRLMTDPWKDDVQAALDNLSIYETGFKTEKIMKEMGMPLRDKGLRERRRVSNILQQLGYESKTVRVGGKTERVWVKK